MSECRLRFTFQGSGHALVDHIRVRVTEAGGRFEGSDTAGEFTLPTPVGTFEGSYLVEGQTIWIEVTNKPFFVPCGAIEKKLRDYVKGR